MPAKPKHDPLKKPDTSTPVRPEEFENFQSNPGARMPHVKVPAILYANVDNKVIVELVKFGQLMLARCEDDTMYLMQGNNTWVEFIFEIVTKEV